MWRHSVNKHEHNIASHCMDCVDSLLGVTQTQWDGQSESQLKCKTLLPVFYLLLCILYFLSYTVSSIQCIQWQVQCKWMAPLLSCVSRLACVSHNVHCLVCALKSHNSLTNSPFHSHFASPTRMTDWAVFKHKQQRTQQNTTKLIVCIEHRVQSRIGKEWMTFKCAYKQCTRVRVKKDRKWMLSLFLRSEATLNRKKIHFNSIQLDRIYK